MKGEHPECSSQHSAYISLIRCCILVVKMSSMGDVIHTLPSITDMRSNLPDDVKIDWAVEEAYASIPRWHPGVAEVIPVALCRWRRQLAGALSELPAYLGRLRAQEYSWVIDAQGLLKSALLGCVPARGESHGYDYSSVREKAAACFYSHRHAVSRRQHAVIRSRQLFSGAIGYETPGSEPDYGIEIPRAESREAIVLIPHAAQDRKLWRESRWLELAGILSSEGLEIEVTWGSAAERKRAERIAAAGKGRVLERMELDQLAENLAGAKGMVSLDTGLSHLGAALAIPNVCLCVDTDPELSGALGRDQVSIGGASELSAREVSDRLLQGVSRQTA